MKVLAEFLAKPLKTKIMLLQAMFYSLYYKHIIQKEPFVSYANKMGLFNHETPNEEIDNPIIKEIKWIVYAIDRWAPWTCLCFDQALMAKKLLNRHGLPCTIYMGVKRNVQNKLVAHAWLRCGTVYVSGGNGSVDGFAVTGIYGDDY